MKHEHTTASNTLYDIVPDEVHDTINDVQLIDFMTTSQTKRGINK